MKIIAPVDHTEFVAVRKLVGLSSWAENTESSAARPVHRFLDNFHIADAIFVLNVALNSFAMFAPPQDPAIKKLAVNQFCSWNIFIFNFVFVIQHLVFAFVFTDELIFKWSNWGFRSRLNDLFYLFKSESGIVH